MCSQPTISFNPDYKAFKFNDKNEGMKEAKTDDKSGLEELFVSDLKSQDCGLVLNPLPDEKKNGNVAKKPLEATEDNVNGDHRRRQTCAPDDSEDSKRRKSHCTVDYELPELVVFLQESSYHFVQDICIDKEMPCKGKCLVENCELDHNTISCILESDSDRKSELIEQTMTTLSSISKGLKPTGEDDYGKNGANQHDSTKLVAEGLDSSARGGISIDQSTKEVVPESLLLVGEVQKAVLTSSMVSPSVDKTNNTSQTSSVTIPKEVESGRTSCDSDSSIATLSGTEEPPLGADSHQQPPETGHTTTSSLDNEISESHAESSQVHQHCTIEESSHFSGLMPHHVSASPSFRSTSHRSNSSTTSSRSFAFPILASEWHGSPERMVKPERRRLRKSQGKCLSFLCCKKF